MVERGLIVTLVLDSCHAGGGTRGVEPIVKLRPGPTGVRGINEVDLNPREHESLVAADEELVSEREAFARRRLEQVRLV
jgi:hypothetical protein